MTQSQENMYKQEYDRLINQPVNEITKMELERIREYLRQDGSEETEKSITRLEQTMQVEEKQIDLYEIFQRGLNAVGKWEQVREEFFKEYEAHSLCNLIQSHENYILNLLEQIAEDKITAHSDDLKQAIDDPCELALASIEYQIDTNSPGLFPNYCRLYRSLYCVKQKHMTDFLQLGYELKQTSSWFNSFQLSGNYTTTRQAIDIRALPKELLDGETDRVAAEINNHMHKYGMRLNEEKLRSCYRYILEMAIRDEANLLLNCDPAGKLIVIRCESAILNVGPDSFGPDKIPRDVDFFYVPDTENVGMECLLLDMFEVL